MREFILLKLKGKNLYFDSPCKIGNLEYIFIHKIIILPIRPRKMPIEDKMVIFNVNYCII